MITIKEIFDKPITGLFQNTDYKVGLIFPIMVKDGKPKFLWGGIPIHNNKDGELQAKELTKQSDFVDWAVNPWDGKIIDNFWSYV